MQFYAFLLTFVLGAVFGASLFFYITIVKYVRDDEKAEALMSDPYQGTRNKVGPNPFDPSAN